MHNRHPRCRPPWRTSTTLDLLAVSIQRMAQAVADWCGADGRNLDEDAASPEARALRWHLGTTAEALRDSRDAFSASAAWARRLLAEPLDTDEDPAPPTALEGSRERSGSPVALDMGCRAPGAGPMTGLTLNTVVVGYDGSPPAERALERAATLVATRGRVVVVTATPSLGPPRLVSEPILDGPPSDERSALLDRSRALLHQRGAEAVLVATDADPAEALIQAARNEGAELILVGQTGSGYVTRALLGSTAQNVLRHAPCDVLVVR
jgi:nucleotide-binding universal stress UspA family protein